MSEGGACRARRGGRRKRIQGRVRGYSRGEALLLLRPGRPTDTRNEFLTLAAVHHATGGHSRPRLRRDPIFGCNPSSASVAGPLWTLLGEGGGGGRSTSRPGEVVAMPGSVSRKGEVRRNTVRCSERGSCLDRPRPGRSAGCSLP